MSNANSGMLGKSKSWADVGDDDFFAAVAQDKSNKSSPTAAWGTRTAETKPAEKKAAAGVPWAFPNPVQQGAPQQPGSTQAVGSPASQSGGGDRFGCFSPGVRRSAPLSAWRRN